MSVSFLLISQIWINECLTELIKKKKKTKSKTLTFKKKSKQKQFECLVWRIFVHLSICWLFLHLWSNSVEVWSIAMYSFGWNSNHFWSFRSIGVVFSFWYWLRIIRLVFFVHLRNENSCPKCLDRRIHCVNDVWSGRSLYGVSKFFDIYKQLKI